jgi:CubicO group peptidase (beta-lactamase class C family)
MSTIRNIAIASLVWLSMGAFAASAQTPIELSEARASDPVALGWMMGSPPPADKLIRYEDGSYFRFPQLRWSFSHWRELRPTMTVSRGSMPVSALPGALRPDLDGVTFMPTGGIGPMTWADSLVANYTDGIVVLHRGKIVYERYFGALTHDRPHIAFSVTKSLFGTLAAMLIDEGVLDRSAKVSHYIPELARSGYGDATIGQLLDMTAAVDFVENYNGSPMMDAYGYAIGAELRPFTGSGPRSLYAFLPDIAKQGAHGKQFRYCTPNVDVIGWVIARVTGKSPAVVLSERIWSRIGAEDDGYFQVDEAGAPLAGFSFNARLRDLARFAELMRLDGKLNGKQIVPAAVVEEIRRGGDRDAFQAAGFATLPGWSYHDFWWISHDNHGAYMARGIHGQLIYIDPAAQMVVAQFASHPQAPNAQIDRTTLPAYRAIAEHLMTHR